MIPVDSELTESELRKVKNKLITHLKKTHTCRIRANFLGKCIQHKEKYVLVHSQNPFLVIRNLKATMPQGVNTQFRISLRNIEVDFFHSLKFELFLLRRWLE